MGRLVRALREGLERRILDFSFIIIYSVGLDWGWDWDWISKALQVERSNGLGQVPLKA